MEIEMFIETPEGIMDLWIITKEFMEGYSLLLENSRYGNVDADILWLRLMDNYLINKCNLKMSKADSCILCKKYYKGKLEPVM